MVNMEFKTTRVLFTKNHGNWNIFHIWKLLEDGHPKSGRNYLAWQDELLINFNKSQAKGGRSSSFKSMSRKPHGHTRALDCRPILSWNQSADLNFLLGFPRNLIYASRIRLLGWIVWSIQSLIVMEYIKIVEHEEHEEDFVQINRPIDRN